MKQVFSLVLIFSGIASCCVSRQHIFVSDIQNFWLAYDRLQRTPDINLHQQIIEDMYLQKGTVGLKEFIKIRQWTSAKFQQGIAEYPNFWKTVRRKTTTVIADYPMIEHLLNRYRQLYPEFKVPDIFFMIGAFLALEAPLHKTRYLLEPRSRQLTAPLTHRVCIPCYRTFLK